MDSTLKHGEIGNQTCRNPYYAHIIPISTCSVYLTKKLTLKKKHKLWSKTSFKKIRRFKECDFLF